MTSSHFEDTFDVFSGHSDKGDAVWIDSVVGFEEAKQRMQVLFAKKPGDYFIFHTCTSMVVARIRPGPPRKNAA